MDGTRARQQPDGDVVEIDDLGDRRAVSAVDPHQARLIVINIDLAERVGPGRGLPDPLPEAIVEIGRWSAAGVYLLQAAAGPVEEVSRSIADDISGSIVGVALGRATGAAQQTAT